MYINDHLIQELRLKNAIDLKEVLPLYPTVRRQEDKGKVSFSTLVRKRYDGVYYLIPMRFEDKIEAKAIHGLHASVYKYLMIGEFELMLIKDSNQENEVTRIKNL